MLQRGEASESIARRPADAVPSGMPGTAMTMPLEAVPRPILPILFALSGLTF